MRDEKGRVGEDCKRERERERERERDMPKRERRKEKLPNREMSERGIEKNAKQREWKRKREINGDEGESSPVTSQTSPPL